MKENLKVFKSTLRTKLALGRLAVAGTALSLPAVVGTMVSLASEEGASPVGSMMESATTALVSGITDMANSIASAIGSIIPLAIPIVGVGLVVSVGLKIFKTVTGS